MPACPACGESTIEYDSASGSSFCGGCGLVLEENNIVSEIAFGELSSGQAIVQGTFVSNDATKASTGGRHGGSMESRERTIAEGRRRIRMLAAAMKLPERIAESAQRFFNLAISTDFIRGRRSQYVIAACLYVTCRIEKTSHMLIDFSDMLQVNVFVLGNTYLKLVRELNLTLPLIEPSFYISRFAALLEFGDETHKVATDAVRLVKRFNRDWMDAGRRPAGICGACLLLAARMNNFRRSIQEIVQVVKIADVTLQKRLDEFARTPSGDLTVQDFRTVWLEQGADPPAYTAGLAPKKKKGMDGKKGKGRRRKEDADDVEKSVKTEAGGDEDKEDEGEEDLLGEDEQPEMDQLSSPPISNGKGKGRALPLPTSATPAPTSSVDDPTSSASADAPARALATPLFGSLDFTTPQQHSSPSTSLAPAAASEADALVDASISAEVESFLQKDAEAATLKDQLDSAETARLAALQEQEVQDELAGLDEDELDAMILTENEVRIKERVWVEFNKDYLEKLAAKHAAQGDDPKPVERKKRKRKNKDASAGPSTTAAASVTAMVKQKKLSKKINYNVIENLFSDGKKREGSTAAGSGAEDKDDEGPEVVDVEDDGHAAKRARLDDDDDKGEEKEDEEDYGEGDDYWD